MRKQHNRQALEAARVLEMGHSADTLLGIVAEWMSRPERNSEKLELVANILENGLQLKYFQNLKRELNPVDYLYFLNHLSVEHRSRGNIIIDKGKKNDNFYIILQGEVLILDEISQQMATFFLKSEKCISDHREPVFETINSLKPGDTFGEVSLINPKMLTTARVVVKCQCTLLVANQDTFQRTLNQPQHMRLSQKMNYFRNSILFESVGEDRLRELLNEIREIRYGLNQRIYEAGNSHEQMYFIVEGEVELTNSKGHGFVRLGERQWFGVEKEIAYSGPRQESAVSKSQQLIVYRIFFKRLSVLEQELQKFISCLAVNLKTKTRFYESLQQNHHFVSLLMHRSQPKASKKKKRRRIAPKQTRPAFEWWGVTNSTSNARLECVSRARYSNLLRKDPSASKDPLPSQSNDNMSRVAYFVRTCKQKLNCSGQAGYSWLEDKENEASYVPANNLVSTLGKRTLKTLNTEAPSERAGFMSKLLPRLNKQKLLKYANSSDNFCDKLYFD